MVEFGKFGNYNPRQPSQVFNRHQLVGMRPAGGIGKGTVFQSQLPGFFLHIGGKIFLTAGKVFGGDDTSVISGLDNNSLDQIPNRNLFADFQKHS